VAVAVAPVKQNAVLTALKNTLLTSAALKLTEL